MNFILILSVFWWVIMLCGSVFTTFEYNDRLTRYNESKTSKNQETTEKYKDELDEMQRGSFINLFPDDQKYLFYLLINVFYIIGFIMLLFLGHQFEKITILHFLQKFGVFF